jgi:hypothetical protein
VIQKETPPSLQPGAPRPWWLSSTGHVQPAFIASTLPGFGTGFFNLVRDDFIELRFDPLQPLI